MKQTLFFLILLSTTCFLLSCGSNENPSLEGQPLEAQIDLLIEQNDYEAALERLENEDNQDDDVQKLREKVHLNYGLHSMNTFDSTEMRTRMNRALIQFTEVLKLNPDNTVARNSINQIMDIYATMPDRGPEPETLEFMRDAGLPY